MEHGWHASHELFNTCERPVNYPCVGTERQVRDFLAEWEAEHGRWPRTGCTSYLDEEGARIIRLV
jgi:hypothetical protein